MPPNPAHEQLEMIVQRCVTIQAVIPVEGEPPRYVVAMLERLAAMAEDYEGEIVGRMREEERRE